MDEEETIKELFSKLINKIQRDFYKIEFHYVFANIFETLTFDRRNLQFLSIKFENYVGDYYAVYRLMKNLVSCGILRRIRPVKNIGFHKGTFFDEYKRVVNETMNKYKEFLETTEEEHKNKELIKDGNQSI
jgi:hypothetical protein